MNAVHESTLFRGNNMAPKYVSEYSQFVGKDYLVATIRPLIARMSNQDQSLEVDPLKLNSDEAAVKQGQQLLAKTCQEWFDFIVNSLNDCPLYVSFLHSLFTRNCTQFPNPIGS